MDGIGMCFMLGGWVAVVAALMWWLPRWTRRRAHKRLAGWAESNGYRVEEVSMPRHENQMNVWMVFRVTLVDSEGKRRDADVSFPIWTGGEPRVEWF